MKYKAERNNFELKMKILQLYLCAFALILVAGGILAEDLKTFERFEKLSDDFEVKWTVDLSKKNVTFVLTAKTRGWLGFGLSPQGGMNNADVIIGGVDTSNKPYMTDRWAKGKFQPEIDEHPDWFLIGAKENETHTVLTVYRAFETCDDQDLPITNDTTKFIWSLADTDDTSVQHRLKGVSSVNILDPDSPKVDTSRFEKWPITVNTTIPTVDTSYYCTFHKSPYNTTENRQIVGFQVIMEDALSFEFNHHMSLYRCTVDPESKNISIPVEGGECYEHPDVSQAMRYCETQIYIWAKGGKALLLPETVGMPVNQQGFSNIFVLKIHYDNPKVMPGVTYPTGIDVLTTTKLRPKDAGVLIVGHAVDISLVVPPNSTNFVTAGHCGSKCTARTFPKEGINVFNVLLHSHLAGRQLKLRHFRGTQELPWASYDLHYDFDYQQNRPLVNELKILPGDQLTYECTYETTDRPDGGVTIGGLSTRHEMCETFLLYWPLMADLDVCASQYPTDKLFETFGIEETGGDWTDPIVLKPASMQNKTYTQVLNEMVNWTSEFKQKFEPMTRFSPHELACFSYANLVGQQSQSRSSGLKIHDDEVPEMVGYPEKFDEYVPQQTCKGDGDGGAGLLFSNVYFVTLITFSSCLLFQF